MPAAMTGRPSRAVSRCRVLPGWAGQRPASENCSVRPSRCGSEEQRLSTQMRAVGLTSLTSAPANCCKLRPVEAETPGATAATGRMPCTGGRPAPIVTKIFWVVLGPRASAVTRRLPTPSTSTGPSGGTSARSSSAACSMTSASRSSSTLTLGTSSVTYRPRGFSRPSRAISTRVTVTPPRRAVAVRTPPGRSAAAAYSSSAISVKRIVFPHFCSIFRQKAVFGALQHKKYGKIKTF